MSITLYRSRRRVIAVVLCAAAGVFADAISSRGQSILKFGLGDRGVNYRMFRDAASRFEFEYPTKDWRVLPSAGSSLAIVARNDGEATLTIDYLRLTAPLGPEEIGTMAEVEIQDLKEKHPNAKDFKSEIIDIKAGRGAMIRYSGVGVKGPEQVMQYSVPVGQDLFRVIAIVPEQLVAKYEGIVAHMIGSFKVPASPAAAQKK
jgi:hypothetical protein